MKDRGFRRQQYRRLKKRWREIEKHWYGDNKEALERMVCIRARTRRPCSCWACKRERYKRSDVKRGSVAETVQALD